ncbi:MAG: hypothetical protein ACFFGZ_11205 [Candidatus Thorarchaeota archaeon]
MGKAAFFGLLILIMLAPLSFAVTEPTGIHKAHTKSTITFVMEWNRTLGGAGREEASSLIQTADGGYALAGETEFYGAGDYDFWLVRTDARGHLAWHQSFGGAEEDSASSLIQTADGGYALAGTTSSYGAGSSDMWLIKISESETAEDSPSWPLVIALVSGELALIAITAYLIFRKSKKHRAV